MATTESIGDLKTVPKEEEESKMEVCPLEAGPSTSEQPEMVEVKPELKVEMLGGLMAEVEDASEQEEDGDDSDFKLKKEMETDEDSDSDRSIDSNKKDNIKHEQDSNLEPSDEESNSDLDDIKDSLADYKKISVKNNYIVATVKEEPIENLKNMFKKSLVKFEKEKLHQQILEDLVDKFNKISLKELQAQYIVQLRQVSKVEVFTCSLCEYQTVNMKSLKCHLFLIHNSKPQNDVFKCNLCDYESNFESYMKRHMPTHKKLKEKYVSSSKKNKEKYPCTECSYKGRSEDGLRRHMVSHKDKTKCDLCTFESEDQNTLKKHKDTHRQGNKFLCYKCPYKNNNKLRVGIHLLNDHKVANEVSKRSKICEICSHTFCNINQLRKHYITHKDISELGENEIYKCTECSHQTKYKTNFQLHLRTHKPPEFICDICGFATKHKVSYEYHLITHKKLDEIEWFRCEICPYQARNKKLLYKHMKTGDHSGKKLLHVRNRDRLREAEEKGIPIETVIRKYKIKRIGGIKIKRERIIKPSKHPKRIRKPKKKPKPENADSVQEENTIQLSRIHEILPQILY